MTKTYTRAEDGPDLDQPFTVLTGFAVIETASSETLLVPAGGCWPGQHNLSAALAEYLCPTNAVITPGTRISRHVSAAAIEGGLACLLVQAFTCFGELAQRVEVAERYISLDDLNRKTAANLVGARRESLGQILKKRRL